MGEIKYIKEEGVKKVIDSFEPDKYRDIIIMGIRKDYKPDFGWTSLMNIEVIGYLQIFIQELLDEMK